MNLPELPYNGSSGWSGSSGSRDRANAADRSGVTAERQNDALNLLEKAGQGGLTWSELAFHYGWHHGQASGALSNLHKGGWIERLQETRERSHIYVLPEWVLFRPTDSFGRKSHPHEVAEINADTLIGEFIYETENGGQIFVKLLVSGRLIVTTRPNSFLDWSDSLECISAAVPT